MEATEEERARCWRLDSVLERPPRDRSGVPPSPPPWLPTLGTARQLPLRDAFCECNALLKIATVE
jgi:hypothetical protein